MRIKQKAIPVKVSTLARCAVIALVVIWEFAGWSFGHNPDAGHLPWLDGISKYYNLNNGVPEIIFWINILWATILAGACALICLAIRECALRVFHIEQITISWGKICVVAAAAIFLVGGAAIAGANNSPRHAIKEYYNALGDGDLEECLTQVPKKLVQYTKDKNYGDEKADIRDLEGVLREKKDQYSDFDTSDDESLYLMQQAEFFCADDVSARITRTEKELSEDSPGKAYAEEYEEEIGEKVSKVVRCKVKVRSDDMADTVEVWCVKIKGKWYCVSAMMTVANLIY